MSDTRVPTQPQGTIWVCSDCIHMLVNGEASPDRDPALPEPWALWSDWPGGDLTPGMLASEHECGWDGDSPREDECDCESRTISRYSCDGCRDPYDGARHAVTWWE